MADNTPIVRPPGVTTPKVRTLGPGSFTIKTGANGKDLSVDLVKAKLTPSTSTDDPTTFLDGSQDINTNTTWAFEGTVMDDFTAGGLAAWLFDSAGKTMEATFVPANTGTIEWNLEVIITPIAIGGDVKAKNTQDLQFPVLSVSYAAHTTA